MKILTPPALSTNEVDRLLGGPVETADELLTTLEGLSFESNALSLVAACLRREVTSDDRVARKLISAEGADTRACVAILSVRVASEGETPDGAERLDELTRGLPSAQEAVNLLRSCPDRLAHLRYQYANSIHGLGPDQREVFDTLVLDRVEETWYVSYDGPDVLGECRRLAQVVLA